MTVIFGHKQTNIIISGVIKTPFPLQPCLRVNDREKPKENGSTEIQHQVSTGKIF
jgi:hypothetical protein